MKQSKVVSLNLSNSCSIFSSIALNEVVAVQFAVAVCSFICQVVFSRRQRSDLCRLPVKLPPVSYQSNHSIEAISFSALPRNTTSELADLSSSYPFLMLNVKQGSCEYQPF